MLGIAKVTKWLGREKVALSKALNARRASLSFNVDSVEAGEPGPLP